MRTTVVSCFLLTALLVPAHARAQDANTELRAALDSVQVKEKLFRDLLAKANADGLIVKGQEWPAPVIAARDALDAARAAILQSFGPREDLSAASHFTLAELHSSRRDYAAAVTDYAAGLAKCDPDAPDFRAFGSLCIAAMNSKDEALAARWMRRLLDTEDRLEVAHPNLSVRTSYYPRTLIALGEWDALAAHLETLAAADDPRSRSAATTFGVVVHIQRGEVDAARERVEAILVDPTRYPDDQSWAVLARLALDVHDGRFVEGAHALRDYLNAIDSDSTEPTAVEKNRRRYLRSVAPYLGRPAPRLRVDHQIGGRVAGDDVLATLRGKVVVLDFWQPWCEPCRKAMPEMIAAQREHGDAIQVLGLCRVENYGYDVSERIAVRPIAAEDYPAHVADFRTDMQLNYPLLVADTAANNTAYGVSGIPTLVVIDRQGIVRYMSCGAGEPGLFRLAVHGVITHGE